MKLLLAGEQQGADKTIGAALSGHRCDTVVMSFSDINKMAEMLRWGSEVESRALHAYLECLCTKFVARSVS